VDLLDFGWSQLAQKLLFDGVDRQVFADGHVQLRSFLVNIADFDTAFVVEQDRVGVAVGVDANVRLIRLFNIHMNDMMNSWFQKVSPHGQQLLVNFPSIQAEISHLRI
jgi:hypothetical protein